jgi:uncharacterized membrane protein YeiH
MHVAPPLLPDATLFATATAILDWLGILVFAVSGALVASRKQMDIFGFALMGTVTGIGGGTLRDVLLGLPVFWVRAPAYLLVCVAISCIVFFTAHIPASRYRVLVWLDAIGLALFAVSGAEKAMLVGAGPTVAIAMAVVTATFGGVIRDMLGAESPVVLSREIYVTAALLGACVFVGLTGIGAQREIAISAAVAAGFALRGVALVRGWSLPRYRQRPGRSAQELQMLGFPSSTRRDA